MKHSRTSSQQLTIIIFNNSGSRRSWSGLAQCGVGLSSSSSLITEPGRYCSSPGKCGLNSQWDLNKNSKKKKNQWLKKFIMNNVTCSFWSHIIPFPFTMTRIRWCLDSLLWYETITTAASICSATQLPDCRDRQFRCIWTHQEWVMTLQTKENGW
jgi:hypothetical protein